jgi:hypothetical protein
MIWGCGGRYLKILMKSRAKDEAETHRLRAGKKMALFKGLHL